MINQTSRLVNVAIPRVRDFRGLNRKSFDGRGNFSMGVKEQIMFPEIDYDQIDVIRGMDITITTTAKNDEEALALLQAFNFPLTPITPKLSTILSRRFFASSPVRRNHFNTTLIDKLIVKLITVVSFIANQLVRCIPCKTAVYSGLDKLYFMGRSAFNVSGDRKNQ